MFLRRGERRRKADEPNLGSPDGRIDSRNICTNREYKDTSDDSNELPEELDKSNKTVDDGRLDSIKLDENLNELLSGSQTLQSRQQLSRSPQMTGFTPANLFSFSGIRSIFAGMMKFGSSGRSNQMSQGLAMLTGCTAVSVLVTVRSEVEVTLSFAFRKSKLLLQMRVTAGVFCVAAMLLSSYLKTISLNYQKKKWEVQIFPDQKFDEIYSPVLFCVYQSRIYSAGGWLEMGRVNGNLNLSRALGDLIYKSNTSLPPDRQIVSPVPDVVFADLTEQDEFLVRVSNVSSAHLIHQIIGCDGIWESSTSQEIVDFIRERIDVRLNV